MTPTFDSRLKATDFMRALAILSLVAAGFLELAPALASAENFDFEDLPVRTVVNAQYGARGVIFFGAYLDNDPHARSGTRVLRSRSLNEEVFTPAPFVMTFTSPQAYVAMHASNRPGATGNGTLKVFDASGTLLARDGRKWRPIAPDRNAMGTAITVIDQTSRAQKEAATAGSSMRPSAIKVPSAWNASLSGV